MRAVAAAVAIAALGAACTAPTGAGFAAPGELEVQAFVARAQPAIEAWFGAAMPRPFAVQVLPDRAALTGFAAQKWGVPELPCWAVAMGTGSALVALAPAAWATEACDHADDGDAEVAQIVAHELVHVFHGQARPTDPELDRVPAWFAEGLATLVSGQLDAARLAQARQVADTAKDLVLDDAWSGAARYAVAGTLVRTLEHQIGRPRLVALLAASTTPELLAAAGLTEAQLVAAWRLDVR